MAKYVCRKLIPISTLVTLTAYSYFYNKYQISKAPSGFETAMHKMGFIDYKRADGVLISAASQQEALLKLLHLAGYLKPEKIWQDIYRLGIKDPEKVFKEIYPILKKSKADQDDP